MKLKIVRSISVVNLLRSRLHAKRRIPKRGIYINLCPFQVVIFYVTMSFGLRWEVGLLLLYLGVTSGMVAS